MNGIRAPRVIRYVLVACACLGVIFLFLLATASANTALFARSYNLLLVLNFTMVAVLMGLVGYQLLRLGKQHKAGVFGSRLAARLVLFFALVAVLPGALLYIVSWQFLGNSIESWFDVRVDRALEGGLNLARGALDYPLKEVTNKATQLALTLQEAEPGSLSSRLNRASEQAGIYEATLFSSSGGVLAVAGISGSTRTPEPPPAQALRKARLQQTYSAIEQVPDQGRVLRVVVPVNSADPLEPLRFLQLVEPVPKQLQQDLETVEAGYRDYQEISFSRTALKRLYALTLTLTLLLALLSALGLAVVLSEQFSRPLGLLAEGTRAVAQGDFSRRHPVQSRDELGVLTESFNTMTAQLAEAQQKEEENRRAIETTRAYLESVLANLSAGVLAFDNAFRLRTANPSAAVILQQPLADLIGVPLADWGRRMPALAAFADLVAEGFRSGRDGQWQRQAEVSVSNQTRVLLMRGSGLPGEPAPGCVVVFDDVSELVQAQRDAAWAEVARRLAHEIKNPLTPIQLSAERLAVKLTGKLDGADEEALMRGTQTIIAQVAAMKHMVDDFAIYARQPRPGKMQPVSLNALLLDVLALYENLRPYVSLKLPEHDAVIQGEPTRLRQVFHNLIQNAFDAQVDVGDPAYEFAVERKGDELTLSVADAGSGFPEDMMRRAFEPYVTTKAKGTGLGLAIVKKIVDEHHGRVTIENRRPRGARVTLYFPLEGTKP
ncbi:MAG TPA: ATP-binding protein [Casimicrobiaceae bacterium]|jgi:nitrogen fixation/metabolism regulation signal transduction histidine kinase